MMIATVVLCFVFVAVLAVVVGGYRFFNRRRLAIESAARSRLSPETDGPSVAVLVKDEEQASDLPFLNRILSGQTITPKLATQLRRANLKVTPGTFLLIVAVSAVLGTYAGSRMGIIGELIGAVAGAALPRTFLQWRVRKRRDDFDNQLPTAIDMLVSALKTGYSFHVASDFLGHELAPPLGPEFARIYDEQRLGIDPATALLGLQERVGSVDIQMFVTAVLIQRKTGGNLSEVLTNTADVMRERADVRRQLDTLTAEAKWSGRLLALLPVLTFFGLSWIAPQFMENFTAVQIGRLMLLWAAISVAIGYFIMMNIAKVDF